MPGVIGRCLKHVFDLREIASILRDGQHGSVERAGSNRVAADARPSARRHRGVEPPCSIVSHHKRILDPCEAIITGREDGSSCLSVEVLGWAPAIRSILQVEVPAIP